jgi:hypothetical protein
MCDSAKFLFAFILVHMLVVYSSLLFYTTLLIADTPNRVVEFHLRFGHT